MLGDLLNYSFSDIPGQDVIFMWYSDVFSFSKCENSIVWEIASSTDAFVLERSDDFMRHSEMIIRNSSW